MLVSAIKNYSIYQSDMKPNEIIKSATVNAAYLIGLSDSLGTLETGKVADIIAVKNNPLKTAELVGKKFVRFWNIWPNTNEYSGLTYRLISILSYGIVLLLSIFYIYSFGKTLLVPTLPLWLIIIYIMSISLITISSIRYRFPVEPILIMFASLWVSSRRKKV